MGVAGSGVERFYSGKEKAARRAAGGGEVKRMGIDGMCKIFEWGVNYGLLLAEEERDSEELFDAVGNAVYSRKYNIPSTRAPRRQPRSVEWRKAMADSARDFIEYVTLESQEARRAREEK